MTIGILGGGITGITIQRFLNQESEILEASSKPGGLCRTYWKDGFGYDIGGHILFSKHEAINTLVDKLLEGNLNSCKRANKIFYNGHFVKYPFENDLAALGKEEAFECLIHYIRNTYPKPNNLKEWAYYTFGKGIAEKYLIPYNEKIWNIPADQLSLEWVDRIPKPPMEDVVKSALGIETEGYLHQLYFRYPTEGGAEGLIHALMKEKSNITSNFKISSIRKKSDGWEVSDGSKTKTYEKLVLTFPMHEAIKCFENVPAEVLSAIDGFRYNSMRIVFLAVNDESLMNHSAVYIPDPEVITHRVCYMGYFSKKLVRPGTSSLIAEITTNPGDGVFEMTDSECIEKTIADLNRIGLIDKEKIITTDLQRVKYGYPVYDLSYSKNVKIMRDWFKSIGVTLCGRFAEFEYINSDECMKRALSVAQELNTR